MGWGTKFDKSEDATVSAEVITWTTNEPTASYAVTVADGDAPTSTEIGQILKTHNTQITAMIADILAIRNAVNEGE